MSDFPSRATQIWAGQPSLQRSQLRAGNIAVRFRFVSCEGPGAKWRNSFGVAERLTMQGRRWAARAILAGLLLCGGFCCGECPAEPSAESIARGKALAVAGDCAGCHTADP